MLYPPFGPSKSKDPVSANTEFYRVLGDDGMQRYKVVFDTNKKETVKEFFMDPLIRKLWPHIAAKLTEK